MRLGRKWEYIFVHTAAHGNASIAYDTSAEEINQWHKGRGWRGIGYNYVVRLGGTVEKGRSLWTSGAHVKGLNNKAIGICLSGHGDFFPPTLKQDCSLWALLKTLMKDFNIPKENVLGHHEVNLLVDQGELGAAYKTKKTCPGILVDMDKITKQL